MDKEYLWHIEDLYSDTEEWQHDYERVGRLSKELADYAGHLSESSAILSDFLKKFEEASILQEKVYVYANQKYHEDTGCAESQKLSDLAGSLVSSFSSAVSFLEPEILEMPEGMLESYEKEDAFIARYHRFFAEIVRLREHTLSKEMENLLADSAEMAETASNIFSMFDNADIKFPDAVGEDGSTYPVTHGSYITLMQNSDRSVRKSAFIGLYHTYESFKNTLGAAFIGNLKKSAFYAKVRKYPSSLAKALDASNIPEDVYHTLIQTVHENMDYMYQYMELRKQVLGIDELHLYDIYVPMVADYKKEVSFEEAKEIVLKALEPLGADYLDVLREGFSGGWIDVYENEGKRSGAYSWGAYGTHPFVLLNYQGQLNDVFTLAHEMGHAIHSYYSDRAQPYPDAGYRIFVAEVASTCNEALLMDYLLKHSTDKEEKAYLLNYFMEQFRTTLYRQVMFAEFEYQAHKMQEDGMGVTAQGLCDQYRKLNELYFGKQVVIDQEISMEWARIPHFYNAYYVYQYATGYSAAMALSRKILQEGAPAAKAYLEFLHGGNSKDSIDLLRGAGVDMAKKEPVEQALQIFGDLIQQYKALLN